MNPHGSLFVGKGKQTIFMLTRLRGEQIHHTISVNYITPTVFILRITRRELQFKPGQHLTLGIPGVGELREYSIYSPPHHDYLEVLVRLVETGRLTPKLAKLRPGDEVLVDGPNGFFTLTDEQILHPQLFIATGTGIAPFHCFAASHKNLDYTIVHGVAFHTEQHDPGHYKPGCYIPCFSRERNLPFAGRVTDWLRQNQVTPQTEVMVCGNSQMILDVWEMLLDQQHPMEKVRQEIYF
jgi:ferredoxin-NADP reductase